jgi:hypothetical protein
MKLHDIIPSVLILWIVIVLKYIISLGLTNSNCNKIIFDYDYFGNKNDKLWNL